MKNLYYDVVIAGCGVAGLYAALNLPEEMNILMLSKKDLESCDSMLAQGGICVLRDESDYDSYFEDTMRAGHYENRKESVDIMIRSSRDVINDLLNFGVRFAKNPDGSLAYTREGAHSRPRICFHEDITGKEITTTLLSHVKKCSNVTILEYTTMTDILVDDGKCTGMAAETKEGETLHIHADNTIMVSGERTALNYLQRLSGIATYTHQVARLLEGSSTTLLDTRKTTPCMRIFEKYAVCVGGGQNHRYNLSDGVLLKDNHIDAAGGVKEAILAAKAYAPFVRKIEVETENLDMVKEAVEAGADIIMLDNMTPEQMSEAIRLIDGRAKTECSGNITKENIKTITALGVDYVSSGALTHSAPILDISLKHLKVTDSLQ